MKIWRIFPGHALFAGKISEEDILIAKIEELRKLDASEINPRRLNAKEVLITQKMENSLFLVADGSVKLSGRDYEFQEPTLRRESTVRRENLEGINKDVWAQAEARKEFHLSSSLCSEKFNLRAERRIIPYFQDYIVERSSSEKKFSVRVGDWKAKTSEAKTNSQGRTEFCTLLQLCARIRKLFTRFFLKVKTSTCCLVSRHSVSVTKILQVTLKVRGVTSYSQV